LLTRLQHCPHSILQPCLWRLLLLLLK
jgi:hypothetical protein